MDSDIFAWNESQRPQEPINVEQELEAFRQQWQQELQQNEGSQHADKQAQPSIEEQAQYLFLQGVNSEQNGKLYEAIKYYRKAVQLVPDIEFRITDYKPMRKSQRTDSESSVGSGCDVEVDDLVQHFTRLQITQGGSLCEPETDNHMPGHISTLPVEIVMYILRWVVGAELDISSLESLSEVCRGLYICARDEELWKTVCQKVFGVNCGRPGKYGTYHNLYLQKPHLRFNGCYISKLEYFRQGEQSLDGFYKPYHLVEYYRYMRFFPNGEMLMLTSPDDPYAVLPRLKSHSGRVQGIMHGYYKMSGDQVTALLKRRKTEPVTPYYRYKRRQNNTNDSEQSFHVELMLKTVGKRTFAQLVWQHYSVHTLYRSTNHEQVADFELQNSNYPPLYFSKVKHYTAMSEAPLE